MKRCGKTFEIILTTLSCSLIDQRRLTCIHVHTQLVVAYVLQALRDTKRQHLNSGLLVNPMRFMILLRRACNDTLLTNRSFAITANRSSTLKFLNNYTIITLHNCEQEKYLFAVNLHCQYHVDIMLSTLYVILILYIIRCTE